MIATANGLLALSIPVEGGRNQRALFRDIRIDYRDDWQVRHWRSIFSAYGKSPWFFQYAPGLEAVYSHRDPFLVDWNIRCLQWVCTALRLDADAPLVQLLTKLPEPGAGSPHGRTINLKDRITPAHFQDSSLGTFPRYPQVFEERWGFQPNLSIIDLVFCVGPGALAVLQGMEIHIGD